MIFISRNLFFSLLAALWAGCASPPPPPVIPMAEQIEVDSKKAKSFQLQFESKVRKSVFPSVQRYIENLAKRLASHLDGIDRSSVRIDLLEDTSDQKARLFSFPGTRLFVPISFLVAVEYENELSAGLAYELAHVYHRHLAQRLEKSEFQNTAGSIFGWGSPFDFDRSERAKSIRTAIELMNRANFDARGMAALFLNHGSYLYPLTGPQKIEVKWDQEEARRVLADQLPQKNSIVRSNEFLNMKQELKSRGHR